MITVVIPREADVHRCPHCKASLHNMAKLGIRRQVDCACGAEVVVDRRFRDEPLPPMFRDRRRQFVTHVGSQYTPA